MKYKDYPYQSPLGPHIQNFLEEKRALGFAYNEMAYQLFRLDQYWYENKYGDTQMTPTRLDGWICTLPGEGKSSHKSRISAVKTFGLYLIAHGANKYVPLIEVGSNHPVIHVMSKTEIQQLFHEIDNYVPHSRSRADIRQANEYPVIFRLYYCCGMRNNEVCSLHVSDIDFTNGIITVLNAKNQTDRLVYLPDDLLKLLTEYYHWLVKELGYEPIWLFPGRDPQFSIPKTSVDRKFKEFWKETAASETCEKDPTPHSLRHTYVVNRLNSWILSGADINNLTAYLSKYLGHKSWDETFYYYHLVEDAFRITREKDTLTEYVIPEVRRR